MDIINETNMSYTNFTNTTLKAPWPVWKIRLLLFHKVLLMCIVVLIMAAMGCNIRLRQAWGHIKRPWGLLIGAACQFVVLPLLAFGSAHAFVLKPEHAIGTIIISTCPGGTTSNLFSYLVNGDISLSVAMTTFSTFLAFGMMPLNIWIYARSWVEDSASIAYSKIAIVLVTILVPVGAGYLINRKSPKAGLVLSKIGSVSGLLSIGMAVTLEFILYPSLQRASWKVWLCSFEIALLGYCLGYVIALICRQPSAVRRTVGFETGSQNVGMALSVIALSYSKEVMGDYWLPPMTYGIAMMLEGVAIVAAHRLWDRISEKTVYQKREIELPEGEILDTMSDINQKDNAKRIEPNSSNGPDSNGVLLKKPSV